MPYYLFHTPESNWREVGREGGNSSEMSKFISVDTKNLPQFQKKKNREEIKINQL